MHAKDINPTAFHGHVFIFGKDRLCAYEYQEGPLPNLSTVNQGFLRKFINYLIANTLTSLIGLQILGIYSEPSMFKLILDKSTVILQADIIKKTASLPG